MKNRVFSIVLGALCVLAIALVGFADTQDKTVGGTSGYPANVRGKTFLLERTIDFALSANTGTSGDVYQMLNIPAGSYVIAAGLEVETIEDSTCTLTIGDGTDADGWIKSTSMTGDVTYAWTTWAATNAPIVYLNASTNATTTTVQIASSSMPAYVGGKAYTSADTIDMTLGANADTLKITIRALVVPIAGTE